MASSLEMKAILFHPIDLQNTAILKRIRKSLICKCLFLGKLIVLSYLLVN